MGSTVTLSQLEAFRAVAATLSYTRAAEDLGYSESAVFQQVRALERTLQLKLFTVHKHRLQLTAIGSELAELADDVALRVQRFQTVAAMFHESNQAQIAIAAGGVTNSYLLRHVLAELRAQYPRIQVRLHIKTSSAIVPGLLEGRYQVGIIPAAPGTDDGLPSLPPGIVARPWLRDGWLLVRAPGVGAEGEVEADEVRRIFYVAGHVRAHPALVALLSSTPLAGQVQCEALETVEAVKSAAVGGLGEAFLPGMSVADELRLGLLELASFPGIHRQLFIVTSERATIAVRTVSDFLATWQPDDGLVTATSPLDGEALKSARRSGLRLVRAARS